MKKGKTLHLQDTIGIIAPASPVDSKKVGKAVEAVEALGYKVKVGESCYRSYGGYLSDTPDNRASELEAMFADPEVDAILCLRGGYGTPHLLDKIDYSIIAAHPKLFIGYSDITALHIAFMQKAGLATVHGPMAAVEIANDFHPISKEYFTRLLTESEPLGELVNPEEEMIECLVPGEATGAVVGGNLSLICTTLGTPYEIDTKGKILFLEDIDEEPYAIDRMLTQLALAGKLSDAAGIVLGTWTDCTVKEGKESFTVKEIIKQIVIPYNKPTILNIQIGHDPCNIPLPLGVRATLVADKGILRIDESITES
ncbi:S66 peptidase family protein [Brevibacillus daliensis]|uniref:S66 peptidase family protein n=1 Tax=Brevibacillus daliensis TaxID=2892995 RepID=UPI001E3FE269|nr:LD-carboxypeptidase [Brevibacillus daliensis]